MTVLRVLIILVLLALVWQFVLAILGLVLAVLGSCLLILGLSIAFEWLLLGKSQTWKDMRR